MAEVTTGVFVSAETDALFHFHFNSCCIADRLSVYNSIEQYRHSHHNKKIACLQMPYPARATFNALIDDLVEYSDSVLILVSELHDLTIDIVRRHDNPKISYFICGEFNFELDHSPVHKFYDWFTTSVDFYRYARPETLDVLTPYTAKPQYFDVLLGRKKLHRDIAYSLLDHNKNIVRYIGEINCNFDDPTKWIWEDEGLDIKPISWTVDTLKYYGHNIRVSQIIPLKVYNQTAYSLVAETNYSNHYSFYTEKTVKPILGRRLFVKLSGQYALKNLQAIGFKTFDGIIDETYDIIEDVTGRSTRVIDQIKYLESRPQAEILEKVKPITEHNFNVMISTDWYDQYFRPAFVSYF
jgi:hypothetical protein